MFDQCSISKYLKNELLSFTEILDSLQINKVADTTPISLLQT